MESVSTTAASNGPAGSDQRTLADDGLRQYVAFTKMLKVSASLASASTVTPPSTANVFNVTGTTTINTIASTNSWDGRDIIFIFAGALTLTNSSNLACIGGANITTAANDAAWWVQTGSGAWRMVGYSRADGSWLIGTQSSLTLNGNLTVKGNTTLGDAGTDTVTVNGNTTVNAPTSGNNFAVAALAGGAAFATTSTAAYTILSWNDGTRTGSITSNATYGTIYGSTSAHGVALFAGGNSALEINSARNATFKAPSSGATLTVEQVAGSFSIDANTSLSGSTVQIAARQASNTASSDARAFVQVAGSSAGDPYIALNISGVANWSIGARNTVNDDLKFVYSAVTSDLSGSNWFNITTDGRMYGTALHNNAGAVTGTTNQYIASGTYTPTLTSVANVTATTSGVCSWIRVGNVVSVWGAISVDPTSATTLTRVGVSLPIASNLAGADCYGTCSVDQNLSTAVNLSGGVSSDASNDRAELYYVTAADVANRGVSFNFGYIVQ